MTALSGVRETRDGIRREFLNQKDLQGKVAAKRVFGAGPWRPGAHGRANLLRQYRHRRQIREDKRLKRSLGRGTVFRWGGVDLGRRLLVGARSLWLVFVAAGRLAPVRLHSAGTSILRVATRALVLVLAQGSAAAVGPTNRLSGNEQQTEPQYRDPHEEPNGRRSEPIQSIPFIQCFSQPLSAADRSGREGLGPSRLRPAITEGPRKGSTN